MQFSQICLILVSFTVREKQLRKLLYDFAGIFYSLADCLHRSPSTPPGHRSTVTPPPSHLQSARVKPKAAVKTEYESDEDVPLSARKKPKAKRKAADSEDEYDAKPVRVGERGWSRSRR